MTDISRRRFPKTSIITPMDIHDSSESIYTDYHNHQNSSNSSPHIDTSMPTITIDCGSNNSIKHEVWNNNYASLENMCDTSIPLSTQSTSLQRKRWNIHNELLRSHSPDPYRKRNEQPCKPIALRPSCSLDDMTRIKLTTKLTDDSGTGESIPINSTPITPSPIHFEIVPIFGQPKRVLMANRYNFDQKKIDEYLNRKCKSNTRLTTNKPTTRHNSNDNSSKKLFKSFFPRFKKPSKSSLTDAITNEPMVRHHLSEDQTIEHF
ncbi:unnamed protein product [Rotaria sp. Silwood2]|nr:unnamed protein product [Rotaria sp. Silwood2]CAF3286518.1 unnamed protein product [Rotaria sp. Silwood2]CAF4173509.1 unnamed protein product [Rotaria sp. Silwood2]CAF4291249.1 unnamed protein product [Rotaria sp. Silwood2]CAF4298295.1 unnamed protein product [Rotaria sp. Silwood2]